MPGYLSLATFLMSLAFFAYGVLKYDPFLYVSNMLPATWVTSTISNFLVQSSYAGKEGKEKENMDFTVFILRFLLFSAINAAV